VVSLTPLNNNYIALFRVYFRLKQTTFPSFQPEIIFSMKKLLCWSILAFSGLRLLSTNAQEYRVESLEPLVGPNSFARSINNRGEIVGYAVENLNTRAFLLTAKGKVDLGVSSGASAVALNINSPGQVVGFLENGEGTFGFLYSSDIFQSLGALGGRNSYAFGINDTGEIAGYVDAAPGPKAFVLKQGTVVELGHLGGLESQAFGINQAGQVVGSSRVIPGEQAQAFLWNDGVLTNLNLRPGGSAGWILTEARAINSLGNIVGSGWTNQEHSAFYFSSGFVSGIGILPGGTNSYALGMNISNQVVGASTVKHGEVRGFLWENGVLKDLNTFIPRSSGWVLREAHGINDSGQIVGWGEVKGLPQAFLMTPIPLTNVNENDSGPPGKPEHISKDSSSQRTTFTTFSSVQVQPGGSASGVTVALIAPASGTSMISPASFDLLADARPAQPTMPGLLSWWSGDSGLLDTMGNNHGTNPINVLYEPGVVGQAYRFNRGCFIIPNNPTLTFTNALTIDLWFKVDAWNWGVSYSFFDKRQPNNLCNYGVNASPDYGLSLYFNDPFVTGGDYYYLTVYEMSALKPLPSAGVFHHLAAVFRQVGTDVELKTYIDGAVVRSNRIPASLSRTVTTSALTFGGANSGFADFVGVMDEIHMFDRALSDQEVLQLFTAPSAPFGQTNPIVKVEFFQDGVQIGERLSPPYNFPLQNLFSGNYSFTAVAHDSAGNSAVSTPVLITVTNAPPVVDLLSPSDGSRFSALANVPLVAQASDPNGTVSRVEMFQGSVLLSNAIKAGGTWQLDWTNLNVGYYTVSARAFDNEGANNSSLPVTFEVTNVPPVISITQPLDGVVRAPGPVEVLVEASDANGSIAEISLFADGTQLTSAAGQASLAYSWLNPAFGERVLTARAVDDHGGTTISTSVRVTIDPELIPPVISLWTDIVSPIEQSPTLIMRGVDRQSMISSLVPDMSGARLEIWIGDNAQSEDILLLDREVIGNVVYLETQPVAQVNNYSVSGNQPFVFTFIDGANLSHVNEVLNSIVFAHRSDAPNASIRTVFVAFKTPAQTSAESKSLNLQILAENDAPVLQLSSPNQSYILDSPPLILDASALLHDPDGESFSSGRIRVAIVSGNDSLDQLTLKNGDTVSIEIVNDTKFVLYLGQRVATVQGGGSGVPLEISFLGGASGTSAQAVLQSVAYYNQILTTSGENRLIEFISFDESGKTSLPAFLTLRVACPSSMQLAVVADWSEDASPSASALTDAAMALLAPLEKQDSSALIVHGENSARVGSSLQTSHELTRKALKSRVVKGKPNLAAGIDLAVQTLLQNPTANGSKLLVVFSGLAIKENQIAKVKKSAAFARSSGIRVITLDASHPGDQVMAEIASLPSDSFNASESDKLTAFAAAVAESFCRVTNRPPVVNAGPDLFIQLGDLARVQWSITDDFLPRNAEGVSILATKWELISSPKGALAEITSPFNSPSFASFSQRGDYTFRLFADDGEFESTDDVVVTVDFPPITQCGITSIADLQMLEDGVLTIEVNVSGPGAGAIPVLAAESPNKDILLPDSFSWEGNVLTIRPVANRFTLPGTPAVIKVTATFGKTKCETAFQLTVSPENDAPQLALPGTQLSYREDSPSLEFFGNNRLMPFITDIDNSNLDGGKLTISAVENGESLDELTISPGASFSLVNGEIWVAAGKGNTRFATIQNSVGANGPNLELAFTAEATLPLVNQLCAQIFFRNSSQDPQGTVRKFSVSVSDGLGGVGAAVRSIAVLPVNDAPRADTPGELTLAADETRELSIGNISPGPELSQVISVSATALDADVLEVLSVERPSPTAALIRIRGVKKGKTSLRVNLHDNGGVENGGIDTLNIDVPILVESSDLIISAPASFGIDEDTPLEIPFDVSPLRGKTPPEFRVSSSDALLFPNGLSVQTVAAGYVIKGIPRQDGNGNAVLNLEVSEGQRVGAHSISLTVLPVNDAPRVSLLSVPAQLPSGVISGEFRYAIEDVDDLPSQLRITVVSGNQNVIPNSQVILNKDLSFFQVKPMIPGATVLTLEVLDSGNARAFREIPAIVTGNCPDDLSALDAGRSFRLAVNTKALLAPSGFEQLCDPTIRWRKLFGPGAAEFFISSTASGSSEASTARPEVRFSAPGDYILQFSAGNSKVFAEDQISVTVVDNKKPRVNAGPDLKIAPGILATLKGSVSDDGLPSSTLSTSWALNAAKSRTASGAPLPSIQVLNAQSSTASVQISDPGSYTFTLTASDGELSESDEVTVFVVPACTKTWTSSGDFAQGTLHNLSAQTFPGQLRLADSTRPHPWVNFLSRNSVVRVLVESGEVVGEYSMAPNMDSEGEPIDPGNSHHGNGGLVVDLDGNTWAIHPLSKGAADLVKIGVVLGGKRGKVVEGNFITDPSGEYLQGPFRYSTIPSVVQGLIRTSGGNPLSYRINEKPVDEAVLLRIGLSDLFVSLAVDVNNNIWVTGKEIPGVGTYIFRQYDNKTGKPLQSHSFPLAQINQPPLYLTFDLVGNLWFVSNQELKKLDLGASPPKLINFTKLVGIETIALQPLTGDILASGSQGLFKFKVDGPDDQGTLVSDKLTGASLFVDFNGHIWGLAENRVLHMNPKGVLLGEIPIACASTSVLVPGSIDSVGKIWIGSQLQKTAPQEVSRPFRISPYAGFPSEGGFTGASDHATPFFPNLLTTRGDLTGYKPLQLQPRSGTWSVIHEPQQPGTSLKLIVHGQGLAEGSFKLETREGKSLQELAEKAFSIRDSEVAFLTKEPFLEIKITLTAVGGQNPVVEDITVTCESGVPVLPEEKPLADEWLQTFQNESASLEPLSRYNRAGIQIVAVSQPNYGVGTFEEGGRVTYVPNTGFNGEDQMTFTVDDHAGFVETRIINIRVAPLSRDGKNPIATPNHYNIMANQAGQSFASSLDPLNDDQVWVESLKAYHPFGVISAEDPRALQIVSLTRPAHGQLTLKCDHLVYKPDPGFIGTDEFRYLIRDALGQNAFATVTLKVLPAEKILCGPLVTKQKNSGNLVVQGTERGTVADHFQFVGVVGQKVSISWNGTQPGGVTVRSPKGKILVEMEDSQIIPAQERTLQESGAFRIEVWYRGKVWPDTTYNLKLDCVAREGALMQVWSGSSQFFHEERLFLGLAALNQAVSRGLDIFNLGIANLEISNLQMINGPGFSFEPTSIPPIAELNGEAKLSLSAIGQQRGFSEATLRLESNDPVQRQFDLTLAALAYNSAALTLKVNQTIAAPDQTFIVTVDVPIADVANLESLEIYTISGGRLSPPEKIHSGSPFQIGLSLRSLGNHSIFAMGILEDGTILVSLPFDFEIRSNPGVGFIYAGSDTYYLDAGATAGLSFSLPITVNDSSEDGVVLILSSVGNGNGMGTIKIDPKDPTKIDYLPKPGASGSDSFSYRITDGYGRFAQGKVTVHLTPAPVGSIQILVPDAKETVLTAPINEVQLKARVTFDPEQVANVQFQANGRLLGAAHRDAQNNFVFTWIGISSGSHLIQATVLTKQGETLSSEPKIFNVLPKPGNLYPAAELRMSEFASVQPEPSPFTIKQSRPKVWAVAADQDSGDFLKSQVWLAKSDGSLIRQILPVDGGWKNMENQQNQIQLLGELDLGTMRNGPYTLVLKVTDGSDEIESLSPIILESGQKLGEFSFAQEDLGISVAGIPLKVSRRYSSFDPTPRDFGVGWAFELQDLEPEFDESRESLLDDEGNEVSVRAGGGRNLTLTLPDGRRTTFLFDFEYRVNRATAVWKSQDGITASLEAEGKSLVLLPTDTPSQAYYYWESEPQTPFDQYEFPAFKLTMQDGTAYRLEAPEQSDSYVNFGDGLASLVKPRKSLRLKSVVQPSGDTISFSANEITHSRNTKKSRAIQIERDDQNRIVSISDSSSGDAPLLKYSYDPHGNLHQVQKLAEEGAPPRYETTYTFLYHPEKIHHLEKVFDGRGIEVARSEFYQDGRLKRIVNAEQTASEFKYDGNPVQNEASLAPGDRRQEIITYHMPLLPANPTTEQIAEQSTRAISHINRAGNVTYGMDALGNSVFRFYAPPDTSKAVPADTYLDSEKKILAGESITTSFAYAFYDNGRVQSITLTDPEGVKTSQKFGEDGNLQYSLDGLNFVSEKFYITSTYQFGQLRSELEFRSRVAAAELTKNIYHENGDLSGLLYQTYDAEGNYVEYSYHNGETDLALGQLGDLKETSHFQKIGQNSFKHLRSTTHTYYSNGQKKTETNTRTLLNGKKESVVTTYFYDAQSRLVRTEVSSETAVLQRTRTHYNAFGQVQSTEDHHGAKTIYTYNAQGELVQTQFPDGFVTRSLKRLLVKGEKIVISTEPHIPGEPALGSKTTYDALGRVVRTSRLKNIRSRLDISGIAPALLLLEPDPEEVSGSVTKRAYDSLGRLDQSVDAEGNMTRHIYDKNGRPKEIIRQTALREIHQVSTYDNNGNLYLQQTEAGPKPANGSGFIIDYRSPWTAFEYDEYNRQIKSGILKFRSTVPVKLENVIVSQYDLLGRKTNEIDQANVGKAMRYDALGRLTEVVQPYFKDDLTPHRDQTVTRYQYDEQGNLLRQYDANQTAAGVQGKPVQFEYDGLGRRIRRVLPEGQSETWSYDQNRGGGPESRTVTHTDFEGKKNETVSDSRGRIISHRPDPAYEMDAQKKPISFDYEPGGRRRTMTDASGVTSFRYDQQGRLWKKITPQLGTLVYSYNNNNQISKIDIYSGENDPTPRYSVDYKYDGLGRLEKTLPSGGTYEVGNVYDDLGRLLKVNHPAGLSHQYQFDNFNRLTKATISASGATKATFDYNPTERPLASTGHRMAAYESFLKVTRQRHYEYDTLYRLNSEVSPRGKSADFDREIIYDKALGYDDSGYDRVGNRRFRSVLPDKTPIGGLEGAKDTFNANDQLTREDLYDNNGNTLQGRTGLGKVVSKAKYDFQNRLISAMTPNGTVNLLYDGDGNLVRKTVGDKTTWFLVDSLNPTGYAQVLEELEGVPGGLMVTRDYFYNQSRLIQDLKTVIGVRND